MTDAESPAARDEAAVQLAAQGMAASDVGALDAAITLLRRAVQARTGDRSRYLSHLGSTLSYRYQLTGDADTLRAAVSANREALAGDPDQHGRQSNLGEVLTRWFELTDDTEVIGEAVALLRASVAGTAPDSRYFAGRQSNLGTALTRWFERTGDFGLLTDSIDAHEQAVGAGTGDRVALSAVHANLANALMLAFRHAGGATHLRRAVDEYRLAAALLPAGHPRLAGCLVSLGEALTEACADSGDSADLPEALSVLREAVAAAVADAPADLPSCFAGLAMALRTLFALRGDALALDEAIGLLRRAAELAGSPPARVRYLSNLALALRNRFEVNSDEPSLHDAISTVRAVLAEVPGDHPERWKYQADLAGDLHRLGEHRADPAPLAEGADLIRAALAGIPAGHRDRAMHLGNLGGLLATLAVVARDHTVLPEAIEALLAAGRLATDRPSERAGYLLNLGHAYMAEVTLGADPGGYPRAAAAWHAVADSLACPAILRALAAQNLGILAGRVGDYDTATVGFGAAAGLLDLVAWRGLERADQERVLTQFGGLAGAAAACAVRTGQPGLALELLEQSRGVLLAQVIDSRSGYDELRRAEPALADRLTGIQDTLHATAARSPVVGRALSTGPGQDAKGDELARLRLATEREQLIDQIRGRPQFGRFLLPPDAALLRTAAREGPIVAIYVSDHGSGALVITGEAVQPVRLPRLTLAGAAGQANAFIRAITANDQGTSDVVVDVLRWLWDTITEPVFDHLDLESPAEGQPLPRLWWMPTGPLTVLPLHAAGHYEAPDDARSALDRVVSSYTPTIRALKTAQAEPLSSPAAPLVVAVSSPPGMSPLTKVVAEAELVMTSLSGTVTLLAEKAATRAEVTARLGRSDWAHFACHAISDVARPSDSGLLLHDGTLRVRELSGLQVAQAGLAFLSACTTAYGGSSLPDETIHISSAFQLAGYASVIGTLWAVSDRISTRIAGLTYSRLASEPPARALHYAVSEIRRNYPCNPSLWAAHVHLGAH